LWTNPSTDSGQAIFILEYSYRFEHVIIKDSLNKTRDIYLHRAALGARMLGTLEATTSFSFGLLGAVA